MNQYPHFCCILLNLYQKIMVQHHRHPNLVPSPEKRCVVSTAQLCGQEDKVFFYRQTVIGMEVVSICCCVPPSKYVPKHVSPPQHSPAAISSPTGLSVSLAPWPPAPSSSILSIWCILRSWWEGIRVKTAGWASGSSCSIRDSVGWHSAKEGGWALGVAPFR